MVPARKDAVPEAVPFLHNLFHAFHHPHANKPIGKLNTEKAGFHCLKNRFILQRLFSCLLLALLFLPCSLFFSHIGHVRRSDHRDRHI
jgi:hypothetical protein